MSTSSAHAHPELSETAEAMVSTGETAFMAATMKLDGKKMCDILRTSPDTVNECNSHGQTALHMLLSSKAQWDITFPEVCRDDSDWWSKQLVDTLPGKVLLYLLVRGSDPTICDHDGANAIALAYQHDIAAVQSAVIHAIPEEEDAIKAAEAACAYMMKKKAAGVPPAE